VLVKVSIDDRDPRILPEMGAKVVFLREGAAPSATPAVTRVLVPPAAIVRSANAAKVWVVVEGRASARNVELGPERGDRIEIRSGLDGGETVVLDPPAGLEEGARVRVTTT
jgi:multidrug efflux pump subunit AcrA (membrane-fusion protein)